MQENYTKTPNVLFDLLIKDLNNSELKILMVIIRQTIGWRNSKTKEYKKRDRITINQFITKTGISRRIVSVAINSLHQRNLIKITDSFGNILVGPKDRKGRYFLYYTPTLESIQLSSTCAESDINLCKNLHKPVQKVIHNKRNYIKRNLSKENGYKHISEVIDPMKSKWKYKIKE